jgi:carbamate kinase
VSVGRLIVALGGNAIAPRGHGGTASEQTENLGLAATSIVDLLEVGYEPVITHGNGPQVGNLLLKNELAADIVPAMPLDWCVAQTQATIGFTLVTQIELELARRGLSRAVASVVTRVLVKEDDPSFTTPTKPIGRWRPDGTRRLVPSPDPVELLDLHTIEALLDQGTIVIACGGGGIPMVRVEGRLEGVEAVIDKDRCAAVLGRALDADRLVIASDIDGIIEHFGTPQAETIGSITVDDLSARLAAGQYPPGSMGPKVEAVIDFVRATGGTAAIGALDQLSAVVEGAAGTQIS